jgi:GxxExxY protein
MKMNEVRGMIVGAALSGTRQNRLRFPARQQRCIQARVDSLFGERVGAPRNKGCDGEDAAATPPHDIVAAASSPSVPFSESAPALNFHGLRVHKELGAGLLESVDEVVLAERLAERGLQVERQRSIPIRFGGKLFDEGCRADLIVNGSIIVEIKSIEQLARMPKKQLLIYLKLSNLSLGSLINFGGELRKGNIERIAVGKVPDLKTSSVPFESSV